MKALSLLFAILFYLSILKLSFPLTIDLIHRHSPLSPFHDPSRTQSDIFRLRNAALRYVSRSKRLHLQSDVIPAIDDPEFDYIMRIYVGTPPLETWAIADSGSDLVWLQCLPCKKCYPQYPPLFNPANSSTYKTLSCHSKPCSLLSSSCGNKTECRYDYGYADGSITRGELARDLINLDGQSGNFVHRGYVFGCGDNNVGVFGKTEAGIVGLGNGPLSLVSQLGPKINYKFSYCLVPFLSNSTGKFKLGENATIPPSDGVVSTPYTTLPHFPTFYILHLEGISVREKAVKLNVSESGETIIDSGTSGTYIPERLYNEAEALIKEAIGVPPVKNPPEDFNFCFKNESVVYNKINNLEFGVQFKGANIPLKPENIFVSYEDNLLCFAIFPSTGDLSLYGNVAQVNFEVQYDLKHKQVSFAPSDCTK